MSLQCGIVGLPNVGKSTLFNCLSNAKAQAANFPFCTIEPNVGVITVPDERLAKLVEMEHPASVVPATTMARAITLKYLPTTGRLRSGKSRRRMMATKKIFPTVFRRIFRRMNIEL